MLNGLGEEYGCFDGCSDLSDDPDLALYGRYVVSQRLEQDGFEFRWPHLRDALQDLFRRGTGRPELS